MTGNVYDGLAEEHGGDARWAYGTGFDDPLASVDASVPEGVDPADLATYCLMLGDDALVMSQRLTQWCTRAPELEEEVALANTGLDLLGQARPLLGRAGLADPSVCPRPGPDTPDVDALAYFRDEDQFRNVTLVEAPGGDFARTMAQLLVFSTWRLALLHRLTASRDGVLAAVAAKGVAELTYHRDYAARWVVRLGDGTAVSRERMMRGLALTWPYIEELFDTTDVERWLAGAGVGVDPADLREEFDTVLAQVLDAACLTVPEVAPLHGVHGREGRHTGELAPLLHELQALARAHPDATW
ncbi:MAG: phenylacetate-CoA oxygenase subunit PaaC [Actinomycetota bacterium]|nr:phenylacetate-CoA oxygenase subunit PaaC [Actinomycetota bacterium]